MVELLEYRSYWRPGAMLKYGSFGGSVNYLSAVNHGVAWSTKKISLQQFICFVLN
ncbi:hypothetical protein M501DRAFT_1002531 [Patellaria atrata CBS 101060]|uniref:Uncharacterized protein n=1 Tax=Patellaria atrata CBS 101060 TaxID=1346257 RepID=A0A9P4VNW2_9PEZI|nr:hypothetical protein M501DRAFT_1002531 [Patellaria atrata CBS 101060]